ncbi:MAG: hypothetical protein WC755_06685 [Candidatus Woesearchaeota archaeon]|jgi:hypothetical protein
MNVEKFILGTIEANYSPVSITGYFSGVTIADLRMIRKIMQSKMGTTPEFYANNELLRNVFNRTKCKGELYGGNYTDKAPDVAELRFYHDSSKNNMTNVIFGDENSFLYVYFGFDQAKYYPEFILNKKSPKLHMAIRSNDRDTGISILESICKKMPKLKHDSIDYRSDWHVKKDFIEKYGNKEAKVKQRQETFA